MKIAQELGIALRKVTGGIFGWSDTGENVLRTAANYTNLAYMSNKFLKKTIYVVLFSPTL